MNHRVQKFDLKGNYIMQFGNKSIGRPSEVLGEFNQPVGIALDKVGNIYVTDSLNHRVQKFDKNGIFLKTFGKKGNKNGEFNQPTGISIDEAGNIYVTDRMNHRVQKFDENCNFILEFGTKGKGDGEFNEPTDIALDKAGNIYVTDSLNNRVQKFDAYGKFIMTIGQDILKQPKSIIVDTNNNVYVSDTMNHRIVKFDISSNIITTFGNRGKNIEEFKQPHGLFLNESFGVIFVADTMNHRIQALSLTGRGSEIILPKSNLQQNLKIESVFNLPNPAKGKNTIFRYKINGEVTRIVIEVYNLAGRLITKFPGELDGDTSFSTTHLSNGVYLYRIIAYGTNGEKVTKIGKLVILR